MTSVVLIQSPMDPHAFRTSMRIDQLQDSGLIQILLIECTDIFHFPHALTSHNAIPGFPAGFRFAHCHLILQAVPGGVNAVVVFIGI